MIPKIIHYCWFGENVLPELTIYCIKTWKNYFPDYQFIMWNETNAPMDNPYMKKAYSLQNWANLSNYTRLFALKKHGGWYFDTDVEILKTPDFSEFKEKCFLGIESDIWENEILVNNAVISCTANHPFISQCLAELETRFDGSENANESSPVLTTRLLQNIGFKRNPGVFNGVRVFDKSIFYPISYFEDFSNPERFITKKSISIHHFDLSWKSNDLSQSSFNTLLKEKDKFKSLFIKFSQGRFSLLELLKINFRY
ncbi:MAG: glycosyltransferase, partial [Algoriphagus sp.]